MAKGIKLKPSIFTPSDKIRKAVGYFDGGANPRGAACAYHLFDANGPLDEGAVFLGEATSNVAETNGLLELLKAARNQGINYLRVKGDSSMVIKIAKREFGIKLPHLRKAFEPLLELEEDFMYIEYIWVPREENSKADELNTKCLREYTRPKVQFISELD